MKGAAERIIERSSSILINGRDLPMTDAWRSRINKAYLQLGGLGERVLGNVCPNTSTTKTCLK